MSSLQTERQPLSVIHHGWIVIGPLEVHHHVPQGRFVRSAALPSSRSCGTLSLSGLGIMRLETGGYITSHLGRSSCLHAPSPPCTHTPLSLALFSSLFRSFSIMHTQVNTFSIFLLLRHISTNVRQKHLYPLCNSHSLMFTQNDICDGVHPTLSLCFSLQ